MLWNPQVLQLLDLDQKSLFLPILIHRLTPLLKALQDRQQLNQLNYFLQN